MSQTNQKEFRAGLYIRLSREDGDKGTSDSILNQEKMLKNFVEEKEGITFGNCYIDEDYTGTNFKRPSFQRMMNDIKQGRINSIVIKDLSRFGRNFIESSRYIEDILPNLNCRFISVLDNVDSYENPEINTDLLLRLKNLIHDNNSQEISKKVRAVKDMQRREGKYICPFAPYGYVKDPNNKHRLIIDEDAAHNVRNIFDWYLKGMGMVRIAEKLNRLGILSLSEYKKRTGKNINLKNKTNSWYPNAIRHILSNKAYIGALDQKRVTTRNYKDRKLIRLKEEDHIIVYDTHEPIIERYKFNNVQEMIKSKGPRTAPGRQKLYLFSGFLRCADCDSSMIRSNTVSKGKNY
ncbi:MAG: recombinase family protein, partial [Clostridiales bacterium]|nr:recombinase family protein [Clostridiales bacterium]